VSGQLPIRRTVSSLTTKPARLLHHWLPQLWRSELADTSTLSPDSVAMNRRLNDHGVPVPFEPGPHPSVRNPVLTGADVDDFGHANYVADPFLFPMGDRWHLFVEVYNEWCKPTAAIGHATSSDGRAWTYEGRVLTEPVHLSYPYVFAAEDERYLVPDQKRPAEDATVTLYRARSFPTDWEAVATIIQPGRETSDHVVFRRDDRWWCLVGHQPTGSLYAYYSDMLERDEWLPHRDNPVVEHRPHAARPGGRPIVTDDETVVFYQDCTDSYGQRVNGYRVTELTEDRFEDEPLQKDPVLEATGRIGWNAGRMHHIDPWPVEDGFVCAVDGDIGLGRGSWASAQWSIGVFWQPIVG